MSPRCLGGQLFAFSAAAHSIWILMDNPEPPKDVGTHEMKSGEMVSEGVGAGMDGVTAAAPAAPAAAAAPAAPAAVFDQIGAAPAAAVEQLRTWWSGPPAPANGPVKPKPSGPKQYKRVELPTPDQIMMDDTMNNCVVKTVLATVMGSALGAGMGIFFGAFEAGSLTLVHLLSST